jgi:ferrous iron transport protein B
VGKSTVFNMLTGLNQHVGNWPGKTVERREGYFEHHGERLHIVDLPGTYCLTAASPEETIARDYIIQHKPDVVMVIINAASLERNLYLVAELLALPSPLVIGLNMMDVAKQEGFAVEANVLGAAIGVPVVPMVAAKGQGVHELLDAALQVAQQAAEQQASRPEIRADHRQVLDELEALLHGWAPDPYPVDWVALKMLEGDAEVTTMMRQALPGDAWRQVEGLLREHEDALIAVASGRYEWIRRMTRVALTRPRAGRVTLTQRLDQVATHPFLGLVLLAVVLAAVFGLTYSIGGPMQEWIEAHIIEALASGASRLLAGGPRWLLGLVVDGVIGGVGTILTFLPILTIFFATMGLLEDVGYMARAAYVMDRFMHALGLHGKSFMPLFLGFGCNVPAVMGTRIIESASGRLLTVFLAPLVPCAARLAVLTVLAQALFPSHAALVTWGLTALPLMMLALMGAVAHRLFARGDEGAFIMEMPLYHQPNLRTLAILVWQRLGSFLKKAATVIMVVSVLIWALATLPHGDIETSFIAAIGRFLEPVGALMGLGWRQMVALLTSFVAKENAVATLGVLYGANEVAGGFSGVMQSHFTPASGLAFLVFQMLFIPCVATVAAIRQETNSWRWTLLNIAVLAAIALAAGTLTYQLGMLWLT